MPDQCRGIPTRIIAKMRKKPPHGLEVALYCAVLDAAVAPQPDLETLEILSWLIGCRLRVRWDNARVDQVIDEQPDFPSAVVATSEFSGPDKKIRMRTATVMRKEARQNIVIDLDQNDIVQVKPDDEVPTALPVCNDRIVHISLLLKRLKERLHHAAAALNLCRHPHLPRFHEQSEKPVQMPSGAFEILAVTMRTGAGAVVAQESVQDANIQCLDPCPIR